MTDKVHKIREEVEKLHGNPYYMMAVKDTLAIIDSLQEEPVSEDLEKASKEWLAPQLDKSYAAYGEVKMMELTHFDGYAMLDAIEFGVKWQKTKDESTTEDLGEYINELSKQFTEVSFAKLSRIAVRVANWQKEKDQETIETAIHHAYHNGRLEMKEYMMKEIKIRLVDAATNQDKSTDVVEQTYYNGMVDALGRLRDKFMEVDYE